VAKIPFDFIVRDKDRISLVRIRRLKYASYRIGDITRSCAREIKELRMLKIPEGLFRELWVRGPDRTWHRYRVMPESIELLEEPIRDEPDESTEPELQPESGGISSLISSWTDWNLRTNNFPE